MEKQATSIANRGDPIPQLHIESKHPSRSTGPTSLTATASRCSEENDKEKDSPRSGGKRDALKKVLPDKIKEKLPVLQEASSTMKGDSAKQSSRSVQERLFNMLLQQVVQADDLSDVLEASPGTEIAETSKTKVTLEKPGFSLPTLSSNFRRFNSRIGLLFALERDITDLFTWKKPSHTISFLAVYTLVCLDPAFLTVMPLAGILFFIMVPNFLARRPPPPASSVASSGDWPYLPSDEMLQSSLGGPPLAPARSIKPAPELSKDFIRNLRDLQNSMNSYTKVHDEMLAKLSRPTDFSDEALSSTVFVSITYSIFCLFVCAHLIPWRAIFLVNGWCLTIASHPSVKITLTTFRADVDKRRHAAEDSFEKFALSDIVLEATPETREVEVFELQRRNMNDDDDDDNDHSENNDHTGTGVDVSSASASSNRLGPWGEKHDHRHRRSLSASSSSFSTTTATTTTTTAQSRPIAPYEPFMFSPGPYVPLSSLRSGGDRPRGTRFFEDVRPPLGWTWADKKWSLDLLSREWVEERCITGVEVEVEGERWVTDLLPTHGSAFSGGGRMTATSAETDSSAEAWDEKAGSGAGGSHRKSVSQQQQQQQQQQSKSPSWEEEGSSESANAGGTGTGAGRARKGEWRRRRWVRLVKRLPVPGSASAAAAASSVGGNHE